MCSRVFVWFGSSVSVSRSGSTTHTTLNYAKHAVEVCCATAVFAMGYAVAGEARAVMGLSTAMCKGFISGFHVFCRLIVLVRMDGSTLATAVANAEVRQRRSNGSGCLGAGCVFTTMGAQSPSENGIGCSTSTTQTSIRMPFSR